MRKIKLREFANFSSDKMLEYTERRVWVEVEDDEGNKVVTDTWALSVNWFGLILHRYFNHYPYLIDEVLVLKAKTGGRNSFINDDVLQKVMNNLLGRILPDINDPEVYDFIKQLIFAWQTQLHNFLCIKAEVGVVSARAMDVLEVYNHPRVKSIKERLLSKEITMSEAAGEFHEVMMDEADFDRSVLALLYRTGGVNGTQTFQLVIARGSVFDLNSEIMPNEILSSYCEGVNNLADSLADSKGAGFSLISNGAALQDSEWFHKKIHNLAQVVRSVRYQTDCGTTTGAVVKIFSKDFKKSLVGKHIIKEDGTTVMLTNKNLDIIKTGDTVKVRSIAWCKTAHEGKPCSVCFGKMETAIPYNPYTKRSAVIGLFYGSTFAEPIGQSILKTKHRIGSATAKRFVVRQEDKKWIKTDDSGDFIYFNEEMIKNDLEPELILDKETQQDFSDYKFMDSIDSIDSSTLKQYENISLKISIPNPMVPGNKGVSYPLIVTEMASRRARFTKGFIEFLLEKPIEPDGKKFKISLEGWDFSEPAFELPMVNEDLDAYRNRVENFFKFAGITNKHETEITPEIHGDLIVGAWKVISEKYPEVNIIIPDIFLWASMSKDPGNMDYRLPVGDDKRYVSTLHDNVVNRGLGNALFYGYHNESLLGSVRKYCKRHQPMGALECYFHPIASNPVR